MQITTPIISYSYSMQLNRKSYRSKILYNFLIQAIYQAQILHQSERWCLPLIQTNGQKENEIHFSHHHRNLLFIYNALGFYNEGCYKKKPCKKLFEELLLRTLFTTLLANHFRVHNTMISKLLIKYFHFCFDPQEAQISICTVFNNYTDVYMDFCVRIPYLGLTTQSVFSLCPDTNI